MKVGQLVEAMQCVAKPCPDNVRVAEVLQGFLRSIENVPERVSLKVLAEAMEEQLSASLPIDEQIYYYEVLPILEAVSGIVSLAGTKSAKDSTAMLLDLFKRVQHARLIEVFVKTPAKKRGAANAKKRPPQPLRSELVAEYIEKLNILRVGTPEFGELLLDLKNDKKARGAEMAAIANGIGRATPKSATRTASHARIAERHEAYLTARSKGQATAGTSAT